MRLVFVDLTYLHVSIKAGKVKGYQLVYEPEPSHAFIDASTGKDLFGLDHYKLPSAVAVEKSKKVTNEVTYSNYLTGIKKVLQK